MTTKPSIKPIPAPALRAQPINQVHRAEFTLEFTRLLFEPKIVAALPKDIADPQIAINQQIELLKEAFPLLSKPGMGKVYGQLVHCVDVVTFPHLTMESVTADFNNNYYGLKHSQERMFGNEVRETDGLISAFNSTMKAHILRHMPNTKASKELLVKMNDEQNKVRQSLDTIPDTSPLVLYVPNGVRNLRHLVTEKKSQKSDGTIVRTPVIKKQYIDVIPKKVQSKILAFVKSQNKAGGAESLEQEIKLMYQFSQELFRGLKICRNTKQLQERHPEFFNEFCGITGLGNCNGKELMSNEGMGTVAAILAEAGIK